MLDPSTTLTDCALASLDGTVVGYLDSAGTLRFASAASDPPVVTNDWSKHGVETLAGLNDVSMTVLGASVVISATDRAVTGVEHVHRSLVGAPGSGYGLTSCWFVYRTTSRCGPANLTVS